MSFVHHCHVHRYVVRLEILLYVKVWKAISLPGTVVRCVMFLFYCFVHFISYCHFYSLSGLSWEISKWLKQHLFVDNFTNPEDNCHMFDNHSRTTDTWLYLTSNKTCSYKPGQLYIHFTSDTLNKRVRVGFF